MFNWNLKANERRAQKENIQTRILRHFNLKHKTKTSRWKLFLIWSQIWNDFCFIREIYQKCYEKKKKKHEQENIFSVHNFSIHLETFKTSFLKFIIFFSLHFFLLESFIKTIYYNYNNDWYFSQFCGMRWGGCEEGQCSSIGADGGIFNRTLHDLQAQDVLNSGHNVEENFFVAG